MGYWGYGNLEGDSPRDFLADLVLVWERIVDHTLAGEMGKAVAYFGPDANPFRLEQGQEAIDAVVMPTIEVMIAVAEKLECDHLPCPEKVLRWAAEALRMFDAQGGGDWECDVERRRIIEETFERLLQIVQRRAGGEPPLELGDPERDLS